MTDVNNFTQSLIEMAEAVRIRPELEQRIDRMNDELRICNDTNVILRSRIELLELAVSTNEAKLSEVTKERDDAMFRNLELEEKLDGFASVAGKLLGMVKAEPPKPEPVVEQVPIAIQPEPFIQETWYEREARHQDEDDRRAAEPIPVATQYDTTTGQTEPVPAKPEDNEPEDMSAPALLHTNWEHGKPYSYKPWYMQDSEWVSLGGLPKPTDEPLPNVMNF